MFFCSSIGKQRGAVLAVTAVLLAGLLLMLALVVGLGFLFTGEGRIQQAANMSALGAIQAFVESPSTDYTVRSQDGLRRANEILKETGRIPGLVAPFGGVALGSDGPGGSLEIGLFYPQRPASCCAAGPGCASCNRPFLTSVSGAEAKCPCGPNSTDYPCFVPNPPGGITDPNCREIANATRVRAHTSPASPLVVPFSSIIGQDRFTLRGSGVGTLVQRCTAYVLDASLSTIFETHFYSDGIPGLDEPRGFELFNEPGPVPPAGIYPRVANWAASASFFAFPTSVTGAGVDCREPRFPEEMFWCSMPRNRVGGPSELTSSQRMDPRFHAQNDYEIRTLNGVNFLVDSFINAPWVPGYSLSNAEYEGPQPLTRFLLAFNVGLQVVNRLKSPGDKGMMYVFDGLKRDREPLTAMTEELGILIQLTDFDLRQMHTPSGAGYPGGGQVKPNAVSRGWVPIYSEDPIRGGTNIVRAVREAVAALNVCPESAQKSVVLATDGISTCSYLWNDPEQGGDTNCFASTSQQRYAAYQQAEGVMLNQLKNFLIEKQVSLTTLLDSVVVSPTYKLSAGGTYQSPEQLLGLGEGYCAGLTSSETPVCAKPIFETEPVFNLHPGTPTGDRYAAFLGAFCGGTDSVPCRDKFAFANQGREGIFFRRPTAALQQLAIETGGVVCVITPPCRTGCSDPFDFDPSCVPASCGADPYEDPDPSAPPGTPRRLKPTCVSAIASSSSPFGGLTCAPQQQSKSEQALACVLGVLGASPYQIVTDELPRP